MRFTNAIYRKATNWYKSITHAILPQIDVSDDVLQCQKQGGNKPATLIRFTSHPLEKGPVAASVKVYWCHLRCD